MSLTIQEAAATLFNAAEIPSEIQKPLENYVDLLVACPKNSVLYYWEEENDTIPWWSILRSIRKAINYEKALQEAIWKRIVKQLDRRRPVCLSVDDYVARRFGKKAYNADYFYSNAHGGVVWGNALVDTVIHNGELNCPVSFELHKRRGALKVWERGLVQVREIAHQLQTEGVRKDRLWTIADCTYGNAAMAEDLRSMGGFYLLGIPKDRKVELFGKSQRLDQFFSSLPQRSLIVKAKKYKYKISTANLNNWGRQRLLAVWGPGRRWRYFASNKLDSTPKTLLQRKRDRWSVDDGHRNLKQFHGAEHFHVWTKESVLGHFLLTYLSCALASLERGKRRYQGHRCTMEQLHREAIRWSRNN